MVEHRSADRQTEEELMLTQVANVNSQTEDVLHTRWDDKMWTIRQNTYVEFNKNSLEIIRNLINHL